MRRNSRIPSSSAAVSLRRLVALAFAALVWATLTIPASAQGGLDSDSPPPVRDYVSCGHFETQADAQRFFDTRELELPEVLDGDGDGIACEDAFATQPPGAAPAEAPKLPHTGSGAPEPGMPMSRVLIMLLASGIALAGSHRLVRR